MSSKVITSIFQPVVFPAKILTPSDKPTISPQPSMAEALGFAVSVTAVIQISEQLVSTCYQYYRAAIDAKKDIVAIITGINALKATLDAVRILIVENDDPDSLQQLRLKEVLQMCKVSLQELGTKLGIDFDTTLNSSHVTIGFTGKLIWPFKERGVQKILDTLERHKATFNLALTGDILRGVAEISESVHTMAVNQRHEKVLQWLNLSDPSTNHNSARGKCEPTTGQWLIKSPDFVAWTEGTIGSLWIHGIPGAGKTILCSTVIEHIKSLCTVQSSYQYAYFYFNFNDPYKRSVTGMLCSIITQLCPSGQLPEEIDQLYRKCKDGCQQADTESLTKVLYILLKNSYRTYIMMDALDECSERKELFEILDHLIQMPSVNMKLFVTSRREREITEHLCNIIGVIMALEGEGVDADISLHIKKSLDNDKYLQKWKAQIKQEIYEALNRGAHGM